MIASVGNFSQRFVTGSLRLTSKHPDEETGTAVLTGSGGSGGLDVVDLRRSKYLINALFVVPSGPKGPVLGLDNFGSLTLGSQSLKEKF